ncbi:hypothetical protein HDU98_001543 [Podochytrium sp. JEL0797]|nr:hypothetical protein HDU98_001543 [Podochytrium sp. JEL0797]
MLDSPADAEEAALPLHRPREYQRFVYEISKTQNTIVVLPTGTGKTLIALLLIKHVHERDAASVPQKVSVFLAPNVPLAMQQMNYLRANCPFEVNCYHGDLGCEKWTDRTWKKELDAFGCLVMTPAIFETVLRRGYLAMNQINLIVFDECHNARKNSIYNQLMALHYLPCPDSEKPLIFGMTASPMSTNAKEKEDIQLAIKQLETNLHSKAITPDSHSDLKHYIIQPNKTIIPYPPPLSSNPPPVLAQLTHLGILNHKALRPLCFDAQTLNDDISPWVADVFLRESFKDLWKSYWEGGRVKKRKKGKVDKRIREVKDSSSGMVHDVAEVEEEVVCVEAVRSVDDAGVVDEKSVLMESVVYGSLLSMETGFSLDEAEMREEEGVKDFIKLACEFLNERWTPDEDVVDVSSAPGDGETESDEFPSEEAKAFSFLAKRTPLPPALYAKMSPKFLTLVRILEPFATDPNFCGICFTERRCSAIVLGYLLPRCPSLKGFLKVAGIVGHGSDSKLSSSSVVSFSMDIPQQKKIVQSFREGALNLLVATKVAEEGIDIQPCNLVVRFDMALSVISNIQSRGRARHKNSQYIVMVNESDFESHSRIAKLEQSEAEMNALLIGKMQQDVESQTFEEPGEPAVALNVSHDIAILDDTIYTTPAGAKMTTFNSVQAIFSYCMMLPQDPFSNLRPIFNTGPTMVANRLTDGHKMAWVSSLQLPLNAPPGCQFLSGKPCSTYADAKRMVALEAVKMLHKAGVYNDRLKLSMYDMGPTQDEADYVLAAQEAFGIKRIGGEGRIGEYDTYVPEICDVAFPVVAPPIPEVPEDSAMILDDDGLVAVPPLPPPKPKYSLRSDVPVATHGYLVLFQIMDGDSSRVLDLAALLPYIVPDESISGKHDLVFDSTQQEVRIFASRAPIPIDAARHELLRKFSNTVFFNALLRSKQPPKDYENDYLMPIVPLVNAEAALENLQIADKVEGLIDWATLVACAESVYSEEQQLAKTKNVVQDDTAFDFPSLFEQLGSELVVVDRKYYNRRYQIVGVLLEKTPWNQREKKMVLAEFYRKRLYVKEKILEDQPGTVVVFVSCLDRFVH